jgi:hypothetical protein
MMYGRKGLEPLAMPMAAWLAGMKSPRIGGQSDWRAVRPGMSDHIAAPFRPGPVVRLANQN